MRKSPTHHTVKRHKRQGQWIESFERGSGKRSQRLSRVVGGRSKGIDNIVPTIVSGYATHHVVQVPEEVRKRVINALKLVPTEHLGGLEIRFADKHTYWPFRDFGFHGKYDAENQRLYLQPLSGLRQRTVIHELGHHVWKTRLSENEKKRWLKITQGKIRKHDAPPFASHPIRAEEYFAELYITTYAPGKADISWNYVDPGVRVFMKKRFPIGDGLE